MRQKERNICGDQGDNGCLELEQGKVAKYDLIPGSRLIQISYVSSCAKASGQVHLQVAFQIKDDGDDDDQFIHGRHCPPFL
jgi:hypothetical protein